MTAPGSRRFVPDRCERAKTTTKGDATGVIITIIITTHIVKVRRKSRSVHAAFIGISMGLPENMGHQVIDRLKLPQNRCRTCPQWATRFIPSDNSVTQNHFPPRTARRARSLLILAFIALASACNPENQKAKQLTASCDKGDAKACYDLGERLEAGRYILRDPGRAAQLFEKSCNGGVGNGCSNLGVITLAGRHPRNNPAVKKDKGAKPDTAAAIALFRKGCDTGGMKGCVRLGTYYRKGIKLTHDDAQAAALFRKACDAGDLSGCASLAPLYVSGEGVAQDFSAARDLAQRSCDAKVNLGCVELGKLYAGGSGITKNDSIAVTLFRKSCIDPKAKEDEPFIRYSADRELEGCFQYAKALELGTGIRQNYDRALDIYRETCEDKHAEACFRGGELYDKGAGSYRSPKRAAEMLKESCDLGYAPACNRPKPVPVT